jgi:selenocysteine-specific translation elongation factor
LGAELGKKGTVSDVTLYNFKLQESVLSFVEASAYPDKVQSLVSSINMADQAILKVSKLDASFAETVVALDALGMSHGNLIFSEGVNRDLANKVLAQTVVSSYPVLEDQPMAIKEKLASFELKGDGPVIVQVDHSFPVKGVGTVALGVVKQGMLKRHDSLMILPQKQKVSIKSLQVNDVDVESASAGLRVGLALKDIRPEDVPRGSLLSADASAKVLKELDVDARLSKYSPRPIGVGDQFSVNSCLNYVPAKVVSGSVQIGGQGRLKLALDKGLPLLGRRVAFVDPGLKMPRVFGHGIVQ